MPFSPPKRVAVVSLWAEDVPAAAHFYRDAIGLPLVADLSHHSGRPHFELNGTFLTILKGKPIAVLNAEPAQFPLFAFAVDDLDAAIERLKAHDVELPEDVTENEGARWIIFHDPAGNLIELVQFKKLQ